MKRQIIIVMALTSLILIVGCNNQYKGKQQEIDKFCNSLTLENYYWDCSEWSKLNISEFPNPYLVKCSFESTEFNIFNIRTQCNINFYLYKEGIKEVRVNDVQYCQSKTLNEAFNYCKNLLPEKLKEIRIIEPKEIP